MGIKLVTFIWLFSIVAIIGSIAPAMIPEPALADPMVLKWHCANTPGSVPNKNDIISPSEVNRIAIGSDGKTFYAVDIPNASNADGSKGLYQSTDNGTSWNDSLSKCLYQAMSITEQSNFHVWNIAVAPDDVNFIAVVTNDNTSDLPRNVWISIDGGITWQNTRCPTNSNISTIDISMHHDSRYIAIGTRTGHGNGAIWILKYPDNYAWSPQGFNGDIMALKFSPNYITDGTIVLIYSDAVGTYLNAGIHDSVSNTTNWSAIYAESPPEVTTGAIGTSPKADQIIAANLELPADFAGQSPSLRRYYVSIDDSGATGKGGIYRIDDTVVYQLMSATTTKRISSIAYHGTCTSGKLLAGELLGNPCSATVMTWFTDSPTTCPIPCWYPAMKPPTGAAGTDNCTGSGYGNTQVAWSPDGSVTYAATASSAVLIPGANWPIPYLTGQALDESAFSLSLNNGETWNQLSLIDTKISWFADIAPAPDCSTAYLTSVNDNSGCSGFDSVWRSQSSPIGTYWERVLCTPTTDQRCAAGQTDLAILRLAGDKADGQVVFWAAAGTQKIMWSQDFGDYWTNIISPRLPVQDMTAEDSNTLYTLSADGWVQKFTFSGTGWVSHAAVPTKLDTGYSIATAYTGLTPDNDKGHIVVGGKGIGIYDVAYSVDGGTTFSSITTQLPTRGNTLVVLDSDYKENGEIFAINTGGMYEWSTYYGGGTWSYPLPEENNWATLWGGPSWPTLTTGLTISRNDSFYFSDTGGSYVRWALASAGLDPLVSFGTEPTTRLRICGGLASGEPTTIWLIDQRPYNPPQGGVWRYVDDLAWNGPTPTSPITNATVKYDPVSGRASGINITWQPSSLSKGYRIQIATDEYFTSQVADIGGASGGPFYTPPDLDAPALFIPPGGGTVHDGYGNTWTVPGLEAGHSYYWRVMVQNVATGDAIQSTWSWRESFTVKAGIPVHAPYQGPKLVAPDNGCLGYPVKQMSFSWSPYNETTEYRFILAKNANMTDIVVDTQVPTSAYQYPGILEYGTDYFWRVVAVEPYPSDWSATFCFCTAATAIPPLHQTPQATPLWVWIIITIGVILVIGLLNLILRRQSL